jgi:hypothetical protein
LKDGRRLGTRRVTSVDTAFADDLFEKLLYKDVDGEKVERRTTVNHAMKTARGAWNTILRAHPHMFPPKNRSKRWACNRPRAKRRTQILTSWRHSARKPSSWATRHWQQGS